jgi:hypothetical protein
MPATFAMTHPAHDPIGPTQHGSGSCQISPGYCAADAAAGDVLPPQVHWIDHIHVEPFDGSEPPEGIHVSAPAATKPMIVPDDQLAYPTAIEQNLADELLGRETRKMAVEAKEQNVIKWELGQNLQSLWSGRQQGRRRIGIHHFQWMRIKCDQHAGATCGPRPVADFLKHRLMSQVDSVERPDCDCAPVR